MPLQKRILITSWNMGRTARTLSERLTQGRLNGKLLSIQGVLRRCQSHRQHLVVNLGRVISQTGFSQFSETESVKVLNLFNKGGNKLRSFRMLSEAGLTIPYFTTNVQEALTWIPQNPRREKPRIVLRHVLNGHSGEGIEVWSNTLEEEHSVPDAPLYVQYIPKTEEYRVHVLNGKVVDVQRKARNSEVQDDDVNWQVRNHQNGFIFMREGVTPESVPEQVIQESLKAVPALGLDFGAVDVIWNQNHDKAYVLEVNASPGMTGTTLELYCDAFTAVARDEQIKDWRE